MEEINKVIEQGVNDLLELLEAYKNGNENTRENINLVNGNQR